MTTQLGRVRRLRRLADQALPVFGIEPVSLSLLSHDWNVVFAVTVQDGSRFVLRIHKPDVDPTLVARRLRRIESELWWLDRLRTDLELDVPRPMRTPGGDRVVHVVGDDESEARLCVLFHWMDGRFLRRGLIPRHFEQVGRLTARLHEHSVHLQVPATFNRQRVDVADEKTEEVSVRLFRDQWSPEAASVMHAVFDRASQAQHELGNGPDTYGLIHADIHQNNYLFNNGQLRLIDFDDCGWGHHLYDFAVTLQQIVSMPRYPALREALMAGYRQVREFSREHEALIDAFLALREAQDITSFLPERDNPAYSQRIANIGNGVAMLEQLVAGR